MLISENAVVTLSYQLFSLGEGQVPILLEEKTVDDPLEFIYGTGLLLQKVEEALLGQGRGYQAQVDLHPRDAFGPYREALRVWLERDKLPKDQEVQLGMKFQTQGPQGDVISVIVKEITDDKVLIDGNHPLAGLHLRFDLQVLRVREATDEELTSKEVDPRQLH